MKKRPCTRTANCNATYYHHHSDCPVYVERTRKGGERMKRKDRQDDGLNGLRELLP